MGNCQTISEEGDRKSVTKFGGKPQIMIKTYTWARDSHGLFDYESKNLTKKSMKTSNPGRVVRQGNEVRLAKENDKLVNKEEKELLKLFLKEGSVYVDNCKEVKDQAGQKAEESLENIDYDLWLVIKSMKNQMNNKGYKLSENDLIKLGRIKFRIRELRGFASKATKCEKQTKIEDDISIAESDKKSCGTPKGSQNSLSQTCRICLSESADSSDPFFSPCNCTGTMKYIHVKCLQRWLKSKLHMKQSTGSISIYWKTLECELCKTPYPTSFIVDEKRYDVVEFDRPECPYIILDILSKDKSVTKGIHILKMENKTNIRLGRGHDSDIRITDISVSRCHAFIKLDKGEFYIDDNNSKFGTLVHLKKAFSVPFDYTDVSLQIGRTLVALTVKRGRKIFGNCFKPPVENYNTSNDEKSSESEEEEDGDNHAQNVAESPSIQRQRTDNNQQARHRPEATYIRREEPEAEEEFEEPEENDEGDEEEEEEEEQEQEQEQIENNDRSEGNVTENVNAVQHHVNSPPQSQRNNSMSQNNNNHNNNNVAELPQIENHHELRPNQPRQPNPDQQSVQSANQTE